MKMQEVQKIAKHWGVNARIGRTKLEIIREIQIREGYSPCFGTAGVDDCTNTCLWWNDCLKRHAPKHS